MMVDLKENQSVTLCMLFLKMTSVAALTLSSESWALTCCADLPGDQTLYAVSILYEILRKNRYRELSTHKFTPMPGVHNFLQWDRAYGEVF